MLKKNKKILVSKKITSQNFCFELVLSLSNAFVCYYFKQLSIGGENMKIAILGSGNIAETHAQALTESSGYQLRGVYSPSGVNTAKFANKYQITAYASFEELLRDKEIEIVSICTPSGLHAAQIQQIAQAGKHVLVEKPLAINLEQAQQALSSCEAQQVFLGVFFQRRLETGVQQLQSLLQSETLGKVFAASCQINWYRSPDYYTMANWRGTLALDGGGVVINQAIHYLDLLIQLFGSVSTVYADVGTYVQAIEGEDFALAQITFKSGVKVNFQATTAAYPGFPSRLEIFASAGTAILENEQLIAVHKLRAAQSTSQVLVTPAFSVDKAQSAKNTPQVSCSQHRQLYQQFKEQISAFSGYTPSYKRELLQPIELVAAIYQSSREKRLIIL